MSSLSLYDSFLLSLFQPLLLIVGFHVPEVGNFPTVLFSHFHEFNAQHFQIAMISPLFKSSSSSSFFLFSFSSACLLSSFQFLLILFALPPILLPVSTYSFRPASYPPPHHARTHAHKEEKAHTDSCVDKSCRHFWKSPRICSAVD